MPKYHRYTQQQIKFLEKHAAKCTYDDLAILFNERFGTSVSGKAITWVVFDRKLLKESKVRHYTDEEKRFITRIVPGRCHAEITRLFNEKFNQAITVEKIKGYIANHGLNTGRTGCFPKGHVPANKGKKGYYAPGSEKGWFKPGHKPVNWRPLKSERINVDGYVETKVSNTAKPVQKRWRYKHVVVWERKNGEVPKGHMIIFLDGNKLNITLDNLMMISRQAHAVMCHMGWYTNDKNATKAHCLMASVKVAIADRKRKSFKDIKSTKMVFLDSNGKRIFIAPVPGKSKWVPARETKHGPRRLRANLKMRSALEAAKKDLYEYAIKRGWQRI
ncbi:MAG: HNH endonuclease [Treponema sp.]|nr:HNH endonuclease [Treponema sp.]